jgi:hypothetical protein
MPRAPPPDKAKPRVAVAAFSLKIDFLEVK